MPEVKKEVNLDLSKLSMPNMEFVVYIVALVFAMIVIAISDALTIVAWFQFYLITTAVYILSRGIAKAHNVKE
jgi:positive regulator of sigma E activity